MSCVVDMAGLGPEIGSGPDGPPKSVGRHPPNICNYCTISLNHYKAEQAPQNLHTQVEVQVIIKEKAQSIISNYFIQFKHTSIYTSVYILEK